MQVCFLYCFILVLAPDSSSAVAWLSFISISLFRWQCCRAFKLPLHTFPAKGCKWFVCVKTKFVCARSRRISKLRVIFGWTKFIPAWASHPVPASIRWNYPAIWRYFPAKYEFQRNQTFRYVTYVFLSPFRTFSSIFFFWETNYMKFVLFYTNYRESRHLPFRVRPLSVFDLFWPVLTCFDCCLASLWRQWASFLEPLIQQYRVSLAFFFSRLLLILTHFYSFYFQFCRGSLSNINPLNNSNETHSLSEDDHSVDSIELNLRDSRELQFSQLTNDEDNLHDDTPVALSLQDVHQ